MEHNGDDTPLDLFQYFVGIVYNISCCVKEYELFSDDSVSLK
jgi:hypothetical protein